MSAWQLLTQTWHWEPSVVVGCAALLALYVGAMGFTPSRAWWFYFGGVATLLFALASPLDRLGDGYLFSSHMIQHLLLVQAVPPLLLWGIPPTLINRALGYRPVRVAERILGNPLVAFIIGFVGLWVSHLPVIYDAALHNEFIHVNQHFIFLVSATIYWWPIFAPEERCRMSPLPTMLYLFGGALSCIALGILLTFAGAGLYPTYLHPADPLGILPLIQDQWGLTPQVDQQVGGLIMWVGGSPVYLFGILAVMVRWYTTQAAKEAALLLNEA